MLKELVTHIYNKTGYTIGTDLFAGRITTASADTAVIVEELTPGMANGLNTDEVWQTFRIVSRALSFFTARSRATTVFKALHGKWHILFPVVTSGELYEGCLEASTPYHIGQDDKGREMYVFNVTIKFKTP